MPLFEALFREALALVLWTTLPVIAAIVMASLLMGAFQALTQVNDMTISLVSHLLAAAIVIVPLGYWMMTRDAALLSGFMRHLDEYLRQSWS